MHSARVIRRYRGANSEVSLGADLDLSSFDDSSTTGDVVSLKHDLAAKLTAARQTNQQYEDRIADLKGQLAELQNKSQESMTVLESVRDELAEENERLAQLNDALPPVDFLREQIAAMKLIEEKELWESLDVKELIEIGILKPGDKIDLLMRRVEILIGKLNSVSKKRPFVMMTEEMKAAKRKYLSFKKYKEGALNQARANLESLRREVAALELRRRSHNLF